jgi:hypothetical protein
MKKTPFIYEECDKAFMLLKKKLVSAPTVIFMDWGLSFALICNANDYVIGVILDQ